MSTSNSTNTATVQAAQITSNVATATTIVSGAMNTNAVYTTTIPSGTYMSNGYTYGNITIANGGAAGAGYAGAINIPSSTFTYSIPAPKNIIALHGDNNQEIVRLNRDGSVTWADEIKVDEAAESFARALTYSAEIKAGVTKGVKLRMRDSVFETLINIAKEKGPLSADDLTYLLESSKIIEKLKGGSDEF